MKRRILLCSGLAALLLLPLAARAAEEKDPFGSLTIDQVSDLIAKHDVAVFDNNSLDRYKQSHLPGAKWVSFKDVKASDLPADKQAKLVFYCESER
jgi:rhodanese-related sulfurtransferase